MGNSLFLFLLVFCFFQTEKVMFVDDFEDMENADWNGRSKGHEKIYKVKSDPKGNFLSAKSQNSDNFILKEIKVDLVQYPYLNWKWRALVLPVEGDESVKGKCDVAASISVVLNASKWHPKSIKYSWSTTMTKGTFSKSPYAYWPARTDIFIVESGIEKTDIWVSEKINVLDHYKELYKDHKIKSKVIEAIVIMTDSDNTDSQSQADYDEIYFSKN